jgi:hypothetical protein
MSEFFYKAAGAVLAPFRYAEREVDHMKEMAKEDLQALVANIIKFTILGIAGLLFLLFISIMAAALINQNMESDFAGYAFVAGFYLLVAVGVYISKQASDHKRKAENDNQKTVGA